MDSTKQRLAEALKQANAPLAMYENALRGVYDDYESENDLPIHELVRDARMFGLHDIAKRAMDGEFDGTKEEAEAWFEGKRLLGS
jgi:hypothetical protein